MSERAKYIAMKSFTVGDVLDESPCLTAKIKFQSWCFEEEQDRNSCLVGPDGKDIIYFMSWVFENQPEVDWEKWLVDNKFIKLWDDGNFVVEMGDFVKCVCTNDSYFKNNIYVVHQVNRVMSLVRVHSGNGSNCAGSRLSSPYTLEPREKVTISKLIRDVDYRASDFKKLKNVVVVDNVMVSEL